MKLHSCTTPGASRKSAHEAAKPAALRFSELRDGQRPAAPRCESHCRRKRAGKDESSGVRLLSLHRQKLPHRPQSGADPLWRRICRFKLHPVFRRQRAEPARRAVFRQEAASALHRRREAAVCRRTFRRADDRSVLSGRSADLKKRLFRTTEDSRYRPVPAPARLRAGAGGISEAVRQQIKNFKRLSRRPFPAGAAAGVQLPHGAGRRGRDCLPGKIPAGAFQTGTAVPCGIFRRPGGAFPRLSDRLDRDGPVRG